MIIWILLQIVNLFCGLFGNTKSSFSFFMTEYKNTFYINQFLCSKASSFQVSRYFFHFLSWLPKGQLISEQIYAVLDFPKMQQNIVRISALAFKWVKLKK